MSSRVFSRGAFAATGRNKKELFSGRYLAIVPCFHLFCYLSASEILYGLAEFVREDLQAAVELD
jgi:hypothetical protein